MALQRQIQTVLMVVADYSGAHSVGSERIRKFIRYLPDFGFRCCVLTTGAERCVAGADDCPVYRAFEPGDWYRPVARWFRRSGEGDSPPAGVAPRSGGSLDFGPWRGLRRWVLDHLMVPDVRVAWVPGALAVGRRIVREQNVDVICSSCPPYSSHLVGAALAGWTRKPLVVDFRDGWLLDSLNPLIRTDGWRRRREGRMEGWVIRKASAVVSVSEYIRTYFSESYEVKKARNAVISNGYDPADWDGVAPAPRDSSRFRLVHTGSLSISRFNLSLSPLLDALALLPKEVLCRMEVLFAGALSADEQAQIRQRLPDGVATIVGMVRREEALAYQMSADCCLLMVGTDRGWAPSKLFEYLHSHRPILALSAVDTSPAEIVRKTNAGMVVDPADPPAIARCLGRLFEQWSGGRLTCNSTGVEQYHRRELTGRLAEILNVAIQKGAL